MTPVARFILKVLLARLRQGNPQRTHAVGIRARSSVRNADPPAPSKNGQVRALAFAVVSGVANHAQLFVAVKSVKRAQRAPRSSQAKLEENASIMSMVSVACLQTAPHRC